MNMGQRVGGRGDTVHLITPCLSVFPLLDFLLVSPVTGPNKRVNKPR